MAEPFFGTGPQLWPAMPAPGFGYFSTMPGGRPGGGVPMTSPSFAGSVMVGAPPAEPTQSMGGQWQSAGTGGPVGGLPPLIALEYTGGITPQALLTAVAMRRGQPMGPTNDQEMEDFICDALDLVPGANDVEVRLENGRATLTGLVSHKRVKRDVGEILWAMPGVSDVQNNITISTRRRARSSREADTPTGVSSGSGSGRKQA